MSKIANDIWAGTLAGSKSHHANIHWAAERRRLNECSKIARFKYLDSIYLCENCQEAWRWRRTRAREMERERERQWWFSRLTGIELSGRPSPENAQSIAQFNYFFGVAATFFFALHRASMETLRKKRKFITNVRCCDGKTCRVGMHIKTETRRDASRCNFERHIFSLLFAIFIPTDRILLWHRACCACAYIINLEKKPFALQPYVSHGVPPMRGTTQ